MHLFQREISDVAGVSGLLINRDINTSYMKYSPIDSNLFIENRKKFKNHLKPNSMAMFVSNDIMPTNADGSMGFRQNSDLFYLSGIDQEDTILVIFPDVRDG